MAVTTAERPAILERVAEGDIITSLILAELEHIPVDRERSPQDLLRMLYSTHRRKQLARDPEGPAFKSLQKAFAATTREFPYFAPSFDVPYFERTRATHR